MARVAFIGVGNMGGPMALNLMRGGHELRVLDRDAGAVARLEAEGAAAASGLAAAVEGVDAVFTMLPSGVQVREVYLGDDGLVAHAGAGTLLVDCSTIDVAAAREVADAASARGLALVDAPVSGGVVGASEATLTFMVGGPVEAVERARPYLGLMGRNVVHTGEAGTGQAAKICNNMILGVSMIAVSEAFNLADRLGLEREKLFEVSATSSGQCWSLTTYCPVPGPVPTSPANRDYAPGFTVAMMSKDLKLAQDAAMHVGASTPLGAAAASLYQLAINGGLSEKDFSVIIKMLEGR